MKEYTIGETRRLLSQPNGPAGIDLDLAWDSLSRLVLDEGDSAALSAWVRAAKQKKYREQIAGQLSSLGMAGLLQADNPKTRKNAARLCGELKRKEDIEALKQAFQEETVRMVRPSQILALGALGEEEILKTYTVPEAIAGDIVALTGVSEANIGDTSVDLSQYYTRTQMNQKLEEYCTKEETYTKTQVDERKQDKLTNGSSLTLNDATELSQIDLTTKLVNKTTLADLYDYMIDKIYPIGSIYIAVNETNPTTLFGGTWVQITDKFLLASGTKAVGVTGGVEEITLRRSDLPRETIRTDADGAHTHMTRGYYGITNGSGNKVMARKGVTSDPLDSDNPIQTDGVHSHTFNLNGNVSQTSLNNMPPYLTVAIWKRTA